MFSDNVLSDVDKEIKLGFDGFDATQYLDDKAAMTYQDFREQFLSYNYCTKERLVSLLLQQVGDLGLGATAVAVAEFLVYISHILLYILVIKTL
ncbi:hypothetical protein ACLB2K_021111 [Fragaria x ananassa]